ncbi:MAG: NUDIX domain-containing protein [Candidatus Liptonbacteria bacterium]|nr:NUDIX domain-containing protein [Candidatus Liptonbacteria bacterium]
MISHNEIPPHAKYVFKGKLFDVWQWEQKLYDGSIKTFERVWRPNTVLIIGTVGDKILIQTEEQPDREEPFESLPGGRPDGEEEPLVTAKRELLEETGYSSDDWELWNARRPVGKMEWTVYTYIARGCMKKQEPTLDAGEKIKSRLISLEEFLELADDPTFQERDMKLDLLRAKLDPQAKESLRKLFFKS